MQQINIIAPRTIGTIDERGKLHLRARRPNTQESSRYYGCRQPINYDDLTPSTARRLMTVLNSSKYRRTAELSDALTAIVHITQL